MKKRALVVVLLTVFALVGLSAGIAQAGWTTVTLSCVGSTGSGYLIKATETSATSLFSDVIFVLDPYSGKGKEMYAAALTAFANSTNLQIYVDTYTDYTIAWGALATK